MRLGSSVKYALHGGGFPVLVPPYGQESTFLNTEEIILTFLDTYISLLSSVHLPIHMSVKRQLDHRDMDILRFLALHMKRWSVLELTGTGKGLSRLLSLASSQLSTWRNLFSTGMAIISRRPAMRQWTYFFSHRPSPKPVFDVFFIRVCQSIRAICESYTYIPVIPRNSIPIYSAQNV